MSKPEFDSRLVHFMKTTFIIEHLEPKLWKWCMFEYEQASKNVGKKNILFTNISRKSEVLERFGKCERKSVSELNLDWNKVCVLDPAAKKLLTPQETRKFDYFVIGGILGEEEFNWRTKKELSARMSNVAVRNLGSKQFTIDNAVFVVHELVSGKKLSEIEMKDCAEIKVKEGETIELPYCYPVVKGKLLMNSKLVSYLKRKKGF
jgi:ribosome biogenesis SPOUT family RNA methylase Rps3